MNPRQKKYYGLKSKNWALVIILIELALIAALIGFWHKQRTLQAEASGYFKSLTIERLTGVEANTTQQQQIIAYIKEVFGSQANNAFKVLSCENHSLNPKARGISPNGSIDSGIFQINSVHKIPERYLYDWRTNIDVAHQIYLDSGWGAWACVTVYHALEK